MPPSVGQSSPAGWSTGPCANGARPTATSGRLVGASSPSARTTRVPGAGTCRRSRRIPSALGQVICPRRARPDAAPVRRDQQVTAACASDTQRVVERGPPRRARAQELRPPAPGGYRSRLGPCHGWRPRWLRRLSTCGAGSPAGRSSGPCRHACRMAAHHVPRTTALTTRPGHRKPWRTGRHWPATGLPPTGHPTVARGRPDQRLAPGVPGRAAAGGGPQIGRIPTPRTPGLPPRGQSPRRHRLAGRHPHPAHRIGPRAADVVGRTGPPPGALVRPPPLALESGTLGAQAVATRGVPEALHHGPLASGAQAPPTPPSDTPGSPMPPAAQRPAAGGPARRPRRLPGSWAGPCA